MSAPLWIWQQPEWPGFRGIERVLTKARFWHVYRGQVLSAEQIKVLNRLLDGAERGFEEGSTRRSTRRWRGLESDGDTAPERSGAEGVSGEAAGGRA